VIYVDGRCIGLELDTLLHSLGQAALHNVLIAHSTRAMHFRNRRKTLLVHRIHNIWLRFDGMQNRSLAIPEAAHVFYLHGYSKVVESCAHSANSLPRQK